MKNFGQMQKILLGSVSVLAMSAVLTPALAQGTEQGVETVVVTGIRASLTSAQAIKQDSDQVVDSITAVDIGALPDRTVAEALQRIPGVQLVRADAVRDPVRYGGIGNGVFIRGLSWVQALVNGRDAFSAVNGQALSFSDISADLMAGVDVYKNPNAKMIEGGVGGTVDLRTRRPFDQNGSLIAFSVDYTYGELIKKGAPSANVLLSDRWNTKFGEVGALLSIDYQDQMNRTNGISGSKYDPQTTAAGATVYVPNDTVGYRQMKWEQSRVAADLALQWRPNDKLEFTATAIYSKADPSNEEYDASFKIPQNADGSEQYYYDQAIFATPAPTTVPKYDAAGNWIGGTINDVRTYNFDTRIAQNHNLNADYSLNMKYNPTDDWAFTADFQYAESRATARNMTAYTTPKSDVYFNFFTWGGCTPADAAADQAAVPGSHAGCFTWGAGLNYFWANSAPKIGMTMNTSGNTPTLSFTNGAALADKSIYFWAAAMDQLQNNYAHDYAYRADGTHTFGGNGVMGWLKAIDFGVRGEYKQAVTRQTGWNWNVLSMQSWDGYTGGPTANVVNNTIQYISTTLPNSVQLYNFGKFLGQSVPSVWLPKASILEQDTVAVNTLLLPTETQNSWHSLAANAHCTGTDYKCMALYSGLGPQGDNISAGINNQKEQTIAGYAMVDFAHDSFLGADVPVDGNVGVRIVNSKDDVAAGWLVLQPLLTACDPLTNVTCADYNAAQTFTGAGGRTRLGAVSNSYTDVMPSGNFRAHLTDQLQARLAYSEAIVRPDISYTQNYTTLGFSFQASPNGGTFATGGLGATGQGGNPNLKPMHAQQYDASLEWYFSAAGSLTFALFHKDLSGYFYTDTRPETITHNGVAETFNVTRTYNGHKGKVEGFEFGYQQFYDSLPGAWGGLGFAANYTKIYNSGGVNATVNANELQSVPGTAGCKTSAPAQVVPGPTCILVQHANASAALPLEGMSNDSFNLAMMYEKYGVSGRLAYNWRSGYLLTSSAANVKEPIWTKNYGQLDGSIFYSFMDHYKLGIQATNLMQARTFFTVGYADRHPWYQTVESDRKWSLILRANW